LNPPADLLLHNARVITLDRRQPRATVVAIKGNLILYVGCEEDVEALRGAETKAVDCQGQAVLPGFNDAHCHPLAFATGLLSVDCRPASVRSMGDLQHQILQRAKETPWGEWIRASGYHEFYLAEKRHPTRCDLDKAAPHHPVKLSHHSGHACVLNTLALERLNISRETPEPPGGIMERDMETGDPSGVLLEMNPWVEERMPPLSERELERGISLANEEFVSHGITSLQDASWSDSFQRWQVLRRLKEQGRLSPHLGMMIGGEEMGLFTERGLSTRSDLGIGLRLGGVKIVLHTTTGALSPPQEELNQLASRAHEAGFQLALHAIEEDEVQAAVTALEYALTQRPKADHRHRVEHCSVCPPRLMQRLRHINAIVVTQPSFLYYSGERYLATVPPHELDWLYPVGSLLRNGVRVAASSDAPVAPVNPLVGIYAAVTRTAQTGHTLLPQEGTTKRRALEMYTINSAYASFEEKAKGRIAPHRLADLVVLSEDPIEVPPEKIPEIEVTMTIIDGKVVWQR